MLPRKEIYTKIEILVVMVVLRILKKIYIPSVSSFSEEARDFQLTADTRNIQQAVNQFR